MLPLYGMGVSRYAEKCRMTLNHWPFTIRKNFLLSALKDLCALSFLLLLASTANCAGQSKAALEPAAQEQNKNVPNLSREVRHQIAELPFYSAFDFIAFTINGRNVTLIGQVVRPSLKKDAESAIKSLEGVDTVTNQIEVLPSSTTDNELRRAIYRAVYEDPVLAAYAVQAVPQIHIIVKNGSVALEGVVVSAGDRSLAAQRAGTVENLAGLKNNLKVQANRSAVE